MTEEKKQINIPIVIVIICVVIIFLLIFFLSTTNQDTGVSRTLKQEVESNIKYDDQKMNVYLFWGNGCEHCEALITFLDSLGEEYDKYYDLYTLEVWFNEDNSNLMSKLLTKLDKELKGVPCLIIGDQVFFGYSEKTGEEIKKAIKEEYKNGYDVYREYQEEA